MGSEPVIEREGNKKPKAVTLSIRGDKTVMRVNRFEETLNEEYKKFLKENGGLAPDLYDLKKRLNKRLEYNENWVSSFLNFFYFESVTGRHPLYKIDRKVYVIPK